MRAWPGGIPAGEVLRLIRELRAEARAERPLLVLGPRELRSVVKRELTRDGVESAVREEGEMEGAAGIVYILLGEPGADDLDVLRRAERARVPVVALLIEPPGARLADPPYVLAEHVVRVGGGASLPVEELVRALAKALGEKATPLAARLPALREPVVDELIRRAARRTALLGAAAVVPGSEVPVLALAQVRLLLRIADAYGFELDRKRLPEAVGAIASGLGVRSLGRAALGLVPVAGWLARGGIAYAGTRAVGEAARRYFSARAPVTRTVASRSLFPR
ncbi:MAG: hypothetical protein C4306_06665 [Thermoleophilia bacterium]